MIALDSVVASFWREVRDLAGPIPPRLWHYTTSEGLKGILESGKLWLTSTRVQADTQEIHWGNSLVTEAARMVNRELGGHPALEMLLYDPSATTFLQQTEMFFACFSDDADGERQWTRGGCLAGGALVFDGRALNGVLRLSETGGTGLVRVTYDDDRVAGHAELYFRRVLGLSAFGGTRAGDNPEYWKLVAQFLMEAGGLAFFAKRKGYSWEREWRLARRSFVSPEEIREPPRRVEAPLRNRACPLVEVVLGAQTTAADEAIIRELAREWAVPVLRSTLPTA